MHFIVTRLSTETNMLDNALYSIIIKTSKGIIFWKNAAHPFSKVTEIQSCSESLSMQI